jgi:exopolysaccharide biosynthesis polyprenyl glycosylphosphotransferase
MLKQHEKSIANIQRLVDLGAVWISWIIAYFIRFRAFKGAEAGLEETFLKLSFVLIGVSLYSFYKMGLYRSQRFSNRYKEIFSVIRGNTMAIIIFIILIYFFGESRLSRLTLGIYFLISTVTLVVFRISIRNFLRVIRQQGKNLRYVLLIGNGEALVRYVETIRLFKDSGIRIAAWIDSNGLAEKNNVTPFEGTYETYKESNNVDTVVLSYVGKDGHKVEEFLSKNYDDLTPIQILPNISYSLVGHQIEDFGGIPVLTFNQPQFSSYELAMKRFTDIIGSLIGLIISFPIFIFAGVLIKLSSKGPIFYGQERVGIEGQHFTMWKFRTMKVAESNEDQTEWSNKENPRKTWIGDLLRKTSLDELPQLWNILLGQMSLIGPRPERPFFVEKFKKEIPGYMLRHRMKAGLSGWAQINGWRGDTDLNKRIECDIYYIKNWSIWFDFKIIFLTPLKGLFHKNAY